MRLNPKKEGKGKKGISPLIGYVLLVVFAVVISSIVFQWLRTYVPAEAMECPDGVSLLINDATFDSGELSLTMTNNGRFSIDGYYINMKNDPEQDLAIIGISEFLDEGGSNLAMEISGYVSFDLENKNSFEPQKQTTHVFDIPEEYGEPYSVSIIPIRQQEHRERERLVSCGNARIEEVIGEGSAGEEEEEEEPYCGDGICNGDETCETCPGDCEVCAPVCGDGNCDSGECDSCSQDCSHSDCCGDGTCNNGETCGDSDTEPECKSDCEVCPGGEITLLEDGFEGQDWDENWDENGITDWDHAIDKKHSGSYSAKNYGGFWGTEGDNDLISDDLDASDADEIQIFFWYNKDDLESGDFLIQIFDGNSYDPWKDLDDYDGEDNCAGDGGDDKWCRFDETITSSEYFISDFRLKFEGTETYWFENVWIDDVSIIKSY
jgi:hypothetical protein